MGVNISQDKRYKYRRKESLQFYVYQRNSTNKIYYVRYKDYNKTVSTGKTNYKDACIFAQVFFNTLQNEQKALEKNSKNNAQCKGKLTLKHVLDNYFVVGSEYSKYDILRGSHYDERILQKNHFRVQAIAKHLEDVTYPKDLTRKRLIVLQEELLNDGLSGKTVNDYISVFHKVYKQLLDKELVPVDPFLHLRPCSHQKELRLCYPLEKMKGIFATVETMQEKLAFVACATGMRRSEIERIQKEDIVEKNGLLWLKVRGTKSVYSVREVPIFEELKNVLYDILGQHFINQDWKKAVSVVGAKIGYDENYIAENGIVFHSYRKLYKTLLTQSNLNTTLIETLMGHTTQNQMSNDVERIYFVSEKADLTKIHSLVVEKLKILVL